MITKLKIIRILSYIKKHNHYPENTDEAIIIELFKLGYIYDLFIYDCECEITEDGEAYLKSIKLELLETVFVAFIFPLILFILGCLL